MQLPRGTFRYIKKGVQLGGILEDLQLMKFSGICTISSGSAQGTLVFKSGKHILAEFRNTAGDTAWDEFQKIAGSNVDVSVSAMDDIQIELSLEFNKYCRIGKAGKQEQSPLSPAKMDRVLIKKSPPPSAGMAFVMPAESLQKPHIQEKQPTMGPSITFETPRKQDRPTTREDKISSPPVLNYSGTTAPQPPEFLQEPDKKKNLEDEVQHSADTESMNFEDDIDAIETMDIDIITSKIRGECKTLIKQLRLDHLSDVEKK